MSVYHTLKSHIDSYLRIIKIVKNKVIELGGKFFNVNYTLLHPPSTN